MALESPEILPAPNKKLQYIIAGVLVIAAIVPSVYFYMQYRSAQSRLANPNMVAEEEVKKIIAKVGKLMILPSEETPTVATVNDKEKLKNQPFFAQSENGDKVLIYTNAKKAVLYRPSIDKIIDVAPVNIGASESAATVANATPSPKPVTFVLRNGTNIVGLTKTYESKLVAKVPGADVVDRENAENAGYTKSFLVDVSGNNAAQATQLAQLLGLTVSPLPAGESTPSSDFLIILGADSK